MPELPEVETTRRGLAPAMVGRNVRRLDMRRADLRFPFQPDFRERIEGRTIERLDRRAKYLIAHLEGGDALVCHLGMSGSFRIEAPGADTETMWLHREFARLEAHDHVVFQMSDGARIIYNDPRRFGFMFVTPTRTLGAHPRLRGVGIEPLEPPLDSRSLAAALAGSSTSLKAALLDQKRIAGLGNIYVCEALHRSGLSPWRSAATLSGSDRASRVPAERLSAAILRVLTEAIEAGGSSLRDFSGADGKPGYFQHSFLVYDREGAACRRARCNGMIARVVQGGRSTFYCPTCQK